MGKAEFSKFLSWEINSIPLQVFLNVSKDVDQLQKEPHLHRMATSVWVTIAIDFNEAKTDG